MQLSLDHSDIDRAIAELDIGIGKEIKAIQAARKAALLADIALIERRIADARAKHKRTEHLSRDFCELTTRRIQFELVPA
jgi:hypothetical protein